MDDILKMHWRNTAGSNKYLGSYSLPDGKDVVLTIATYGVVVPPHETVPGKTKPVISFEESSMWIKPMILCVDNLKALESLCHSTKPEDFIGTKIQIGIKHGVRNPKGELCDALRIRPFAPKPPGDDRPTVETGSAVWNSAVAYLQGGNKVESILGKYKLTKEQIKALMQYEIK